MSIVVENCSKEKTEVCNYVNNQLLIVCSCPLMPALSEVVVPHVMEMSKDLPFQQ